MFKIKITKKQDSPVDGLMAGREFMNHNKKYIINGIDGEFVQVVHVESNHNSIHSKAYILQTFESGASSWII